MRWTRAHTRRADVAPGGAPSEEWRRFGFDDETAVPWTERGFTPFEAALARGDGLTPAMAAGCRSTLHAVARRWQAAGLGSLEGLDQHRRGLTAAQAARLLALPTDGGGGVTSAEPASAGGR